MSYKPYPIFDLRTGLSLAKEAWLNPPDAFSELNNCYFDRGIFKKRKGYLSYGRMVTADTEKIRLTTFATYAAGAKTQITTPFAHGYSNGNTVTIEGTTNYDGDYVIESIAATTFVIPETYIAEAGAVTKTVKLQQSYATSEIMGLLPYVNGTTTSLLAMNRTRFNKYNTTTSVFDDLTVRRVGYKTGAVAQPVSGETMTQGGVTATITNVSVDNGTWAAGTASGEICLHSKTGGNFAAGAATLSGGGTCTLLADDSIYENTGDDSQFFWVANWNDIAYITNGKDQIRTYNGTVLGNLVIDLDVLGGPDNDVATALIVVVYKGRLLLLSPTVDGTAQRQRAMWCEVILPRQWQAANYVDCPTTDSIVTAGFIGEDLIVMFTDSTWKLVYTTDATIPFRWEKIKSDYGATSTYSVTEYSKEIWSISNTRLVSCDSYEVYPIDEKIPDMMLSFNQSQVQYCYGMDLAEIRQNWLSYVSAEASDSKPDKVVAVNYDEMNWSTHDLPVHCLGSYFEISDPTFDDIGLFLGDVDMALDDIDIALDDISLQAGYPVNLMGCRDGYIYRLNYGGTDNGTSIAFSAISGWWNPYTQDGRRADLGYIDFFVTSLAGATCEVSLFMNHKTSAYATRTLKFDPTGSEGEKTRYRIKAGTISDFHRIQISHTASNQELEIHAIVPYFRQAGTLYG